jgi:hypothetical protein
MNANLRLLGDGHFSNDGRSWHRGSTEWWECWRCNWRGRLRSLIRRDRRHRDART